ncbi:MAG: hypothetical protein NTU94_09555 [Planctomycetota bacterium]|nr:hypothetical protein [Planctomycetota bacterium]
MTGERQHYAWGDREKIPPNPAGERAAVLLQVPLDQEHLAVAWALNETYGLDVQFYNCFLAAFEPDHEFHITLALTVLCGLEAVSEPEITRWAVLPTARTRPNSRGGQDCPPRDLALKGGSETAS